MRRGSRPGGIRPKPEVERLDAHVLVSVTLATRRAVEEIAARERISLSAVVRRALDAHLCREQEDQGR